MDLHLPTEGRHPFHPSLQKKPQPKVKLNTPWTLSSPDSMDNDKSLKQEDMDAGTWTEDVQLDIISLLNTFTFAKLASACSRL